VLANPMYATCIGLILKGFLDIEDRNISYQASTHRAEAVAKAQAQEPAKAQSSTAAEGVSADPATSKAVETVPGDLFDAEDEMIEDEVKDQKPRIDIGRRVASIYGTFKNSIKELFSDKEDETLN
jgi:hypothetical protein